MERTTGEVRKDAEAAARELMAEYGVTELWDMPVDVTRLAERAGAKVYVDDLDKEDLDGFVVIDPDRVDITINVNKPLVRRRFTCAHELGHMIQHQREGREETVGFVDNAESLRVRRRDSVSATGTVADEMWANAFAAELLMPEKLVETLNSGGQELWKLARFFRVSKEAMRHRLANLGIKPTE